MRDGCEAIERDDRTGERSEAAPHESADYSSEEAIEAGFYSLEDAQKALAERYKPDDDLVVHKIEEPEYEDIDDDITEEENEGDV